MAREDQGAGADQAGGRSKGWFLGGCGAALLGVGGRGQREVAQLPHMGTSTCLKRPQLGPTVTQLSYRPGPKASQLCGRGRPCPEAFCWDPLETRVTGLSCALLGSQECKPSG